MCVCGGGGGGGGGGGVIMKRQNDVMFLDTAPKLYNSVGRHSGQKLAKVPKRARRRVGLRPNDS